ncbi:F-BOX PROTEIN [Salix koriyanagi]|uniref:F-box protein n=1 Tax=Salix koriyanagi TaxID=2511006 RepID=A0A9Q0ZUV0_9ROSI|nr:F-BOX PROTEIN [Salix koriyanagi]
MQRQERSQVQAMSNRSPNSPSPPQWEVLALLAHHLDPKSLGVASCVSKSWHTCMASDHIWQPFCTSHYPSLSNLKITHPFVSYHRLYAMACVAAKLRARGPSEPRFSMDSLIFDIHILGTKDNHPIVKIAKPGWFSQELPRPRCCSSDSTSGIVADLKLEFCSEKDCGDKVRVDKVSVGNTECC